MNSPDFQALRREFPVLARRVYLNSGSYGALAKSVRAAAEAYLDDRDARGADWDAWVGKLEAVRAGVARLLRALPDEIAITASASAGINSLASALEFAGPRNRVLVSDFEFPTGAQIWHAQERRGAVVQHVPPDADGYLSAEQFAARIDERTRLVAVTMVCYRNGTRLDLPAIIQAAHRHGALVLVDAYQGVGTIDLDAHALGADFIVGGMLKYLLGTAGIGYLFVRRELIETLTPCNSGWFAQRDIGAMNIYANDPSPSARRFEAGTPPVPSCYSAEAGLSLLLNVGVAAAEQRIRQLTRRCMERLAGIGWTSSTPDQDERRGPMVCIPSRDAAGLSRRLLERGIVTSPRADNARATFHFYNDDADIEALIAALTQLRGEFHPGG